MESTVPSPYGTLLLNLPPPLVNCIKRMADMEAGRKWLRKGERPDADAVCGLSPERLHLKRIEEGGNDEAVRERDEAPERWLLWGDEFPSDDNDKKADDRLVKLIWKEEVYTNESDEIEEFGEDALGDLGPEDCEVATEDRLSFRMVFARFLALPLQTPREEREGRIPAGSYFAINAATVRGLTTYHGVYTVMRDMSCEDTIETRARKRIWLNAAAERLLARSALR